MSRKAAIAYTCFNFYRRLAMAMLILTFYFYPVIQVLLILGLNLTTVAILSSNQVLKSRLAYFREIMNESFCLAINYVLLCFTNDFMPASTTRNSLGIVLIWITLTNFALNILIMCCSAKQYLIKRRQRRISKAVREHRARKLLYLEKQS